MHADRTQGVGQGGRTDQFEGGVGATAKGVVHLAGDVAGLEPWDALVAWLRRFVGYMATKQALAAELLDYMDRDSPLFATCRTAMYTAGEPLLTRAQEAGEVRHDVALPDVIQMVAGIAKIQTGDPEQVGRILDIALDGLRLQ